MEIGVGLGEGACMEYRYGLREEDLGYEVDVGVLRFRWE